MHGWREIAFWVGLLGSWTLLNSPAWPSQWAGAAGTGLFLVFAFGNVGKLNDMGMQYAVWSVADAQFWRRAVMAGLAVAAAAILAATLTGSSLVAAGNWRLVLLQIALGPALEEILFRGYLFAALMWVLRSSASPTLATIAAVIGTALAFAGAHMFRPESNWKEFTFIVGTGLVYGWIRVASGSTAVASVAHSTYNLVLNAAGHM